MYYTHCILNMSNPPPYSSYDQSNYSSEYNTSKPDTSNCICRELLDENCTSNTHECNCNITKRDAKHYHQDVDPRIYLTKKCLANNHPCICSLCETPKKCKYVGTHTCICRELKRINNSYLAVYRGSIMWSKRTCLATTHECTARAPLHRSTDLCKVHNRNCARDGVGCKCTIS